MRKKIKNKNWKKNKNPFKKLNENRLISAQKDGLSSPTSHVATPKIIFASLYFRTVWNSIKFNHV